MQITTLENTSIQDIVACLTIAFQDYFVPIPSDVAYWATRFGHARVNQSLSWGIFDQGKLVGYILNAIDSDEGAYTAFNTGTGILPAYRGNRWVKKMYEFGVPQLIERGITRCTLEVIDENSIAIRAYESVGFEIQHRLKCYKGNLAAEEIRVKIVPTAIQVIAPQQADAHYAWDNKSKTIAAAGDAYQGYQVFDGSAAEALGYFIINPANGSVAQLETSNGNWPAIFAGIGQVCDTIKINNVPEHRTELIAYLDRIGLPNTIDQYEMEMRLGNDSV